MQLQHNHQNSQGNNLDSQVKQMNVYRDRRSLITDRSQRENVRDHPDVQDVKMVNYETIGPNYNSERIVKTDHSTTRVAQSNLNKNN